MLNKRIAGLVMVLLVSTAFMLTGEEAEQKARPQQRLRENLQLRQEMRKIEREAIENDAELQAISQELKSLHQKLREKLDAKLEGNTEYQELKEQEEAMRAEWKKRRAEGGQEQGSFKKPRERQKQRD